MTLEELIEEAYKLFDKYTIGDTLDVCKRCCVSDSDEAILVNTPLRKITAQQLRSGYFESARSNSDRELLEMKYFLPRVLELVSKFDWPCASPETVFYRLNLEKKDKWTSEEMQLLSNYAALFFEKCLKYYPCTPDGDDIATIILMFSSAYFDLNPLLLVWQNNETLESLLNFKEYVLYSVKYDLLSSEKLYETDSEITYNKQIYRFLQEQNVKAIFSKNIQKMLKTHKILEADTIADFNFLLEILES